MTLSKAEESLLVCLLTQSFGDQVKILAGYLAAFRPDGKFSISKNPEKGALAGPEGNELVFKYLHTLRNKKEMNITFALHAPRVGKTIKNMLYHLAEYEMQLVIKRAGFVGEQQFMQSATNGVRISTGNLKWYFHYSLAEMKDVEAYWELDFQGYVTDFEKSLVKEVSSCTTKFKRKKTMATIAETRQLNSEGKLKEELFTTHNLVGNERREKLFTYLLKHCNHDLRMVARMFDEMVHIIT
jgi:hypothetical protein